jgi:SAM-dependent methyltransferase
MSAASGHVWVPESGAQVFASPRTHSRLRQEDATLVDASGGERFPVCDGIPDFREMPSAETPAEAAQLDQLNLLARERGWQTALAEVHGAGASIYRYVTDAGRSKFLDLLPLTRESMVLEIGPGLGQFTGRLASAGRFVHALEVVPGQARFVQERCRQEGLQNVCVACGGDTCWLPYVENRFDTVVCNLVFEWCASRDDRDRPEAAQERLLQEFNRILKPGGTLYLATKNRYALRYLLGKTDEHAYGLRFGNALPRWLMRWALLRIGKERPQGLLHSHRSLARMIANAGFRDIRSFWAAPEMRYPERMVSTEPAAIRAGRRQGGFAQGECRSTRILMPMVPARLVRHVTPGLAFLAKKLP